MATVSGKFSRVVGAFLRNGLRDPSDIVARRKVAMCNVISLIGILNAVPLGMAAYLHGNVALGLFDHVVSGALALNLINLRRTCNVFRASAVGLTVVATLFLYLFVTGGVRGTGHLWFYTFPLISAFLLGSSRGALYSLSLLIAALGIISVGSGRVPWIRQYEADILLRFVPSFLVVLAYSYFFERFSEQSHRALLTRNEQLGQVVGELKEKERALEHARGDLERKVAERTADLHRANEDLRHSHDRFTTVLDSMDANVYAADMNTHEILFMNRRMVSIFGGDLTGEKCFEEFRGQTGPCSECTNPGLLDESGNPTGPVVWEGLNQKTGHWYLYHDRAVEWVDGRYVRLQVATDISKRKQAEKENAQLQKQLLLGQKMQAIGTLAGGVAHDLNNILSAIVGYPDLLLMDLPEDSPLRGSLLTIKDSGEKCSRIVQDLLTLARRVVSPREPLRLGQIVEKYVQSPEYLKLELANPATRLACHTAPGLLPILGSEVHIFKSLMNLVTNAFEAMPNGGELTISLHNRHLGRSLHGYTIVPPGDYVVLEVSDTGSGILGEDLPHIFEPFYTRKVMGRSGTGLGMAVVWGTVSDHQGFIDLHSIPGQGSRFSLYFPVTRLEVSDGSREESARIQPGNGERILVVDDVPEQLRLVETVLTRIGYEVCTASTGEKAVEIVTEDPPDLLVLDMIMDPGIDGLETYRRSLAVRPGQRAIITSGFSETDRVTEALHLGAAEYVKKPFRILELAAAVRHALDRKPPGA